MGISWWQMPFTELRAPKIANLRMDPFERVMEAVSKPQAD